MKAIVLCCAVLVTMAGWTAASAPPAVASTIHLTKAEKTMLALVNHARTSRGRHALRVVASLERASRSHSRDMLRRGYFSHNSHGGGSYAARLLKFGYSPRDARPGRWARSSAGARAAPPRRGTSSAAGWRARLTAR